jgi:uncharacterized protein YndB with AHSA1/START domain
MDARSETRGATDPAKRSLVITRVFDAPRALLWKAWTDPRHLAQWWGPRGFTNPVCEVDPRQGGVLRIVMRGPDGVEYPMTGVFRAIVEPERLIFTSVARDSEGRALLDAVTTVSFAEQGARTKLTVEASAVALVAAAERMLDGMEPGWTQSIERLVAHARAVVAERPAHHATFVIERLYEARPALVFAAWASREAKARWFVGPPGKWTETLRELDFRVGGRERLVGAWEGGRVSAFDARFQDIVPDRRIVYAYDMYVDDVKISVSLATVAFKPEGAGTRMIFTEQVVFLDGYDDPAGREHGTRALLDRLDAALRR